MQNNRGTFSKFVAFFELPVEQNFEKKLQVDLGLWVIASPRQEILATCLHPVLKGEGARPVRFSKKIFSPNWLISGTWGFSITRNRLTQVPSSEKIFVT